MSWALSMYWAQFQAIPSIPTYWAHPKHQKLVSSKYILGTYDVSGTVLGPRNIIKDKTDTNSCPHGAYILGKGDNTQIHFRLWKITMKQSILFLCGMLIFYSDAFKSRLSHPVFYSEEDVYTFYCSEFEPTSFGENLTFFLPSLKNEHGWVWPFSGSTGSLLLVGGGCLAGSWGLPRTGSAAIPGWAAHTLHLFQPPDSGTDDLEKQEW